MEWFLEDGQILQSKTSAVNDCIGDQWSVDTLPTMLPFQATLEVTGNTIVHARRIEQE